MSRLRRIRQTPTCLFWPHSLKGQVLLALALALLLTQGISAVMLYRAQTEHRREAIIRGVALRLSAALRRPPSALPPRADDGPDGQPPQFRDDDRPGNPFARMRPVLLDRFAPQPGDIRLAPLEADLREILAEQDLAITGLQIYRRPVAADPAARARLGQGRALMVGTPRHGMLPDQLVVAAVQRQAGGPWLVVRSFEPPRQPMLLVSLFAQTLFIYAVLVGAMALILRRITRPLALLTQRLELFGDTRKPAGQLTPQGPWDMRRLIEAHNAMEARILALLDEKDVMLGAIGHDLKTPLASLRVRIEQVEDAGERGKMAATIEDIVRTLDDILSLARVGRPSDPLEQTDLAALVGAVVDEFEDLGEPVTIGETTRIAMALRATWLRRALRNLIGNALRYGSRARLSVTREAIAGRQWATLRIEDDGQGIPDDQLARMLEPFTRGDPSRNKGTGGTGLGLTLALAIAQQHGGSLTLANRRGADGAVAGLTATLRLPV